METSSKMKLIITGVDGPIFDGDVDSITVPSVVGELTLLPQHEPYITLLKEGTIVVRDSSNAEDRALQIKNGVLETSKNLVTILL